MPDFEMTPLQAAFSQHAAQLRRHLVAPPPHPVLQTMREAIEVRGIWKNANHPDNPGLVCHGEQIGFAKSGTNPSIRLTREKLLCDIGYDAGFPLSPCAFQTIKLDHQPQEARYLISAAPSAACATLKDGFNAWADPKRTHGEGYRLFFAEHPQLIPNYLAIYVLDLWFGVADRHRRNIATSATPEGMGPLGLHSYDYEKNILWRIYPFTARELLAYDVFRDLAAPAQTESLAKSIRAIEAVPAPHIHSLANRLIPHTEAKWNAAADADLLIQRQKDVRTLLLDGLAPATREALTAELARPTGAVRSPPQKLHTLACVA